MAQVLAAKANTKHYELEIQINFPHQSIYFGLLTIKKVLVKIWLLNFVEKKGFFCSKSFLKKKVIQKKRKQAE